MMKAFQRRPKLVLLMILVFVVSAVSAAWIYLDSGIRPGSEQQAGSKNTQSPDDIDRRIRDFILNNPEVIVESVRKLQDRRKETAIGDPKTVISARQQEIFSDPQSPVGGNPDGDVTIVEFFDYNCPYCRRVVSVMAEAERNDPKLRFAYKEWPILGPGSVVAAKAALASVKQGKYLEFHKNLMGAKIRIAEKSVMEIARSVGLDTEQLKRDMDDPAIDDALKRNFELARALRISGTPSFVIGDQVIRGATDLATLQSIVTGAREQKK